MTAVLIVDDEPNLCRLLSRRIAQEQWDAVCVHDLKEARTKSAAAFFDIVLLDIHLPDGNGLEALPDFVRTPGKPEVIIMTGYQYEDAAGLALEYGAWDYIEKPLSLKRIILSIRRGLEYRRLKQAGKKSHLLNRAGIIGSSEIINDCLEQLAESADGDHSLLISGETGTGKELFARAAHRNSHRAEQNFIVVDCTALTENLTESILFGHVRGAFTDARQDRDGLIKLAHRGTLFLDEVGELPLAIQKKFLRVLDRKRFRPVGSEKVLKSNFRLICATNCNLAEMVRKGTFRQDLFYRLQSQNLILPPLKHRKEDIPELVNHYLPRICRRLALSPKTIQPEFLQCLYDYDWPGNVRELINLLEQIVCTAGNTPSLFHIHLPVEIRSTAIRQQTQTSVVRGSPSFSSGKPDNESRLTPWQEFRKAVLQNAEKEYFTRLLDISRGDIRNMTKTAGMSKSRIYELLHKHNLLPSIKPPQR